MSVVIAVDVGGTFTDVSIVAADSVTMGKVRSTADPVDGVLQAIDEVLEIAGVQPGDVTQILHATTVATNAIFERTGARTAVIATLGFGDIVHIGREVRTGPERFRVTLPKPYPFVEESDVFEIAERIVGDGSVYQALDEAEIRALGAELGARGYETVAVALLHSYRSAAHELQVRHILGEVIPDVDIMLSHEICPEPGEYERTMTTIVSAYISPLVGRYVERLRHRLVDRGVRCELVVVGSDGSGIDGRELRLRPLTCLESGPVAGVLAGRSLADALDLATCLTLDIGGTTSKAGLVIDGRLELTKDFRVGGAVSTASRRSASAIPVRVPVVDLAELGVGGGSIAWVDDAGSLRVGPTSVGAMPGPASFGYGGDVATVTDAAVVTGILRGQTVLGTNRPLDLALATRALASIGDALGIDPVAAAVAVRGVASAEIAAAVQRLLFYRGVDPRTLTLMAFGGTGPLHAADVAEIVGISTVLVPRAAGVFTTVGLLSSEIGREKSMPVRILLDGANGGVVETAFADLEREARLLFQDEAMNASRVRVERSAEIRFSQQLQTLPLNLRTGSVTDAEVFERFCREYERQFRLPPGSVAEVVELRVRVTARNADAPIEDVERTRWALRAGETESAVLGLEGAQPTRRFELVHEDGSFSAAEQVAGPALALLPHTTAVVPSGWDAYLNAKGDLMVVRTIT